MLYQLSYDPEPIAELRLAIFNGLPIGISKSSITVGHRQSPWGWEELNLRPHAYQACALTSLSYSPAWYCCCQGQGPVVLREQPAGKRPSAVRVCSPKLFAKARQEAQRVPPIQL